MRYCNHCGSQIADDSAFCGTCGKPVGNTNRFCSSCGAPLDSGKNFCIHCGARVQPTSVGMQSHDRLLQSLSVKLTTNGIIWIVIGALQILSFFLVSAWFIDWWLVAVGILNIISAIQDIKYAKQILVTPEGIVEKCEPLGGAIISLIYNLIFGGIIGVAGSIYYLVAIRSFVMTNKNEFLAMAPHTAPKFTPQRRPVRPKAPVQKAPDAAQQPQVEPARTPPSIHNKPANVQTIACPSCGKTQFAGAKKCFHCGKVLE